MKSSFSDFLSLRVLRRFSFFGKRDNSPWLIGFLPAFILIAIFIFAVYLLSWLPNFFYGEDFFLFHYAETHRYLEAIKIFFLENGRLLEGVYWVSIYKLIGYQPTWMHVGSLVMNLIVVSLASWTVFSALSKRMKKPTSVFMFCLFSYFVPLTLNWAFRLSGDNSRISLMAFFISAILLQKWARSNLKLIWLVISLFVFSIGVFTYENISLLFPAGLLLSVPLLPKARVKEKKTVVLFAILTIVSLLIEFFTLMLYAYLARLYGPGFTHPSATLDRNQIIPTFIQSFVYLGNYLVNNRLSLFNPPWIGGLSGFIFLFIILYSSYFIIKKIRGNVFNFSVLLRPFNLPFFAIYLCGIWIMVMGIYPYALGSHYTLPPSRYYSSAIYGIVLLFVLAFEFSKRVGLKFLIWGLLLVTVLIGINEFRLSSEKFYQLHSLSENNYLSLVHVVPAVGKDTVFLFVDHQKGNSPDEGCGNALSILYSVEGIRCAFLSSTIERYYAERTANGITANEGGRFSDGSWIIVGEAADGSEFIIDEIKPDTSLLIKWDTLEPIKSNRNLIISDKPRQTQMYVYLLRMQ
jgi:hypothetical protein